LPFWGCGLILAHKIKPYEEEIKMARKSAVAAVICLVFAAMFSITGCASIVGGGSSNKVTINSQPDGIDIQIVGQDGSVVFTGKTPATVGLKRGAGYFKGADYVIKYKTPSGEERVQTITHSLNGGWYIAGNIIFGAFVGWLIVDPLTGAMYTLPKNVNLQISYTTNNTLNIISLDEIGHEMRKYLVPVN
jgi:hypothetical protein